MRTCILLAAMLGPCLAGPAALAEASRTDKDRRPPLQVMQPPGGEPVIVQEGEASYYADRFHQRPTASGERYDRSGLTAASRDLPLGSTATVKNLETGREVDVRINDRGPYAEGRVIDLSKRAAEQIGLTRQEGEAPVQIEAKPSEQPDAKAREALQETAREVARSGGCPAPQPGRPASGQPSPGQAGRRC